MAGWHYTGPKSLKLPVFKLETQFAVQFTNREQFITVSPNLLDDRLIVLAIVIADSAKGTLNRLG